MILNFDKELIHASAFSNLTTEPKEAKAKANGELSVTTKTFLKELYLEKKYGRKKEITTKQMEKGTLQEEAAITLYCRLHKKLYQKNTKRFENKFVTGEPDLLDDPQKPEKGVDIKCSWSIFTFPFPDDKLSKAYVWQNQNYMYLTDALSWSTAHCLVNAPASMIIEAKKNLYFKMRCPADNDPTYIEKCIEIEKNMIFDLREFRQECKIAGINFDLDCTDWHYDIPMKERVIEFVTPRDKFMIDDIPEYVIKARRYLNGCANGIF